MQECKQGWNSLACMLYTVSTFWEGEFIGGKNGLLHEISCLKVRSSMQQHLSPNSLGVSCRQFYGGDFALKCFRIKQIITGQSKKVTYIHPSYSVLPNYKQYFELFSLIWKWNLSTSIQIFSCHYHTHASDSWHALCEAIHIT